MNFLEAFVKEGVELKKKKLLQCFIKNVWYSVTYGIKMLMCPPDGCEDLFRLKLPVFLLIADVVWYLITLRLKCISFI